MIKQALLGLTLFSLSFFAFSQRTCHFYDDFASNAGWTQVGADVLVTNGRIEFQNGAPGQVQRRIHKQIGKTLNSTDTWTAEIDFHPTSVGTYGGQPFVGHYPIALTAGTNDLRNDCSSIPCTGFPLGKQDGIHVIYVANNPPDGNLFFQISIKDSVAFIPSPGTIIANDLDTTYYLRLERLADTLVRLGVYWDAARTLHVNGSPIQHTIPSTVTGLTTVQAGVETSADIRRELFGWSDDLCIRWEDEAPVEDCMLYDNFASALAWTPGRYRCFGDQWKGRVPERGTWPDPAQDTSPNRPYPG
ncbi:MAG: hypothetical protein R3B47_03670 [Bacteroidia bacterium]